MRSRLERDARISDDASRQALAFRRRSSVGIVSVVLLVAVFDACQASVARKASAMYETAAHGSDGGESP